MLEFLSAASGKHRSIAKAEMRAVVQNRHVGFAKQARNRAQRTAKPAIKKHRVLAPEKLRDTSFEFPVQIGHSGEHR